MDITQLLYFIGEREAIRLRRASGSPPPWTSDPILREWSFTNVRRENDRVTRLIRESLRDPYVEHPDLWFIMCVARFVNWPDTLAEIGCPVPWDGDRFVAVIDARKARGEKVYGDAYMIRADNTRTFPDTARYQAAKVFKPLWDAREWMRPKPGDTLAGLQTRLSKCHGMGGGFMSAQIVADVKQAPPLAGATDWWTFVASGPGSRRGLNRVVGRDPKAKWSENAWLANFRQLHEAIAPELERIGIGRLCGQDLQNCLCELDKYERFDHQA